MQVKKAGNFKRNLLDQNFDLEKNYFFKEVSSTQLNSIKEFVKTFFSEGKSEETVLKNFFNSYPVLRKGEGNIKALRKIVDEVAFTHKSLDTFFDSYKALINFIEHEYLTVKPTLLEAHFFPNEQKEDNVINMLRTCKKSLDIAIFTLTNDKIFAAIEEVWNDGADVRIITDDECTKQIGSDIFKLAALVI